jgi:hypothetical protein
MIDMDIIEKICLSRDMKKLTISSFPTFATKSYDEGLEVKGGKILNFWANGQGRDYEQPPSEFMKKTIELINYAQNETQEETPKPQETEQSNKELVGILPEVFTPALISKWGFMGTLDRVLLFQHTPKDKIDYVVVGKKDGKDIFAPYVKGNYMFREANAAFLFDWYLSDVVITVGLKGVSVVGKLNAWFKEYNKYLQRPATGYQELNAKVDAELARKGATTDAIKKGLSLFGFNSDVYSGERD